MSYSEENTGQTVLFEHLSRSCFDHKNKCLIGFTILEDGNFYQTRYKLKPSVDRMFPVLKLENLDEKNYEKHLIWNSIVLSNKLKQLINLHQEEINNLPKFVSNNLVLDGKEDFVRIKDKLISGCNIFYQVPYSINQNKFKELESEQQANEKALELLTLFYNEVQTILLKELNHFNGFSSFCKKCNETFYLPLGEQLHSVIYDYKEILYLCPNCGTWEHKKVHLFDLPRSSTTEEKDFIGDIEDEDPEKRCPNCNEYMIHYEKYNPLAFNKMICPKCNELLEDEGPGIFN